ncbi:MAG: SEC-C domain-containing protein, partial [Pararhodobacter sp.]|nr:SEC-C domain-containing protein [Pararhodobacter sp.]
EHMLSALREEITRQLCRIRPLSEEEQKQMMLQMQAQQAAAAGDGLLETPIDLPQIGGTPHAGAAAPGFDEADQATWGNPGRNEPCPCGSGKKFKHCHGRLA